MAPVRKCLVNGCASTSGTASVCWWPRSKQLARVWIDLLAPRSSRLTSSLVHRDRVDHNFCVCKLHFEKKFFNGEKRIPFSWPTLFTEEEILTRKPAVPVTGYNVDPCMEHNYSRKRHIDHTYCTSEPLKEIKIIASDHCYEQRRHHEDHTYYKHCNPGPFKFGSLEAADCDATNITQRLFCMPMKDNLRNLWMSILVPNNPYLLLLSKNQLLSKRVCQKHFDRTQFDHTGARIRYSYPCLFTQKEFDHGVPLSSEEYSVLNEHNYNKVNIPQKLQNDIASRETIVLGISDNVTLEHCYDQHCHHEDFKYLSNPESMERARCMSKDHIYSKKHHHDHSYAKDTVLPKYVNTIDPETNINSPKLNALLSQNDEKDLLDVRKSSLGEKTDINFGKHVVESKASRDSGDSNPYVEGIPETYNDVEESSFQDQDLQESQQEPLFSWEKMEVVSADEGDSVACLRQQEALDRLPADISLYCDDDSSSSKPDSGEKAREPEYDDYKCNLCQEFILGFRYTCVQCADFDLCAACEARGAHDAHYVLRVPGHRPYNEIQAVLHALRQQILSENLFLDPIDDRLKEEIKIEPDEAPVDPDKDPVPGVGLPPDIDPLPVTDPLSEQRPESQNTCESSEESDDDSTTYGTDEIFIPSDHSQLQTVSSDDSDASRSPRRKRTRITSPKTYEQHNQTLPLYYIPQKHNPPSTTSHNIIHTPRMPTRFYQTVNIQEHRTETNAQEQTVIVIQEDQELRPTERTVLKEPIVCLNRILDQENFIVIQENQEEIRPRENIAQKEPRVLVPRIDMQLQKQGNHRETILQQLPSSKDHAMLIDQSHQIEIVLDSDDDEPMEIMPENLKNDEQPEFILKLPPNTNEEALIQALQSLVTVRLKRDF